MRDAPCAAARHGARLDAAHRGDDRTDTGAWTTSRAAWTSSTSPRPRPCSTRSTSPSATMSPASAATRHACRLV